MADPACGVTPESRGRRSGRGVLVAFVGASVQLAGEGLRFRSLAERQQVRDAPLFRADGPETVHAVNEAALIPFASIEPAVELSGPGQP